MKRMALLVALIVFPVALTAQTGLPPFGSFTQGGFDTINNQNLNVVFSVPIVSIPGRGIPLNLNLVYNSLLWQNVGNTWAPDSGGNANAIWGWQRDFPAGGTVTFNTFTESQKCEPGGYFAPVHYYNSYVYTDAFGTAHYFPINFHYSGCPAYNGGTYAPAHATDASGYYIANAYNPVVFGPNGQQVTAGTISTAMDVNGNYVTKTIVNSTESDWTDSVGNKALKIIYSPNTTSPTSIQYQFLDGNGNYQTITLKLQSYPIKTNFACSGVVEYTGSANLPYELDIPSPVSGTIKYLFSYEPTPSNSGYYTGRVQRVTMPTGGYYEWDYGSTNDGVNCSDGTTLSMNRVVNDGTNSATWKFVRNTANLTTTITTPALVDTPNANDTVYAYNVFGQETSRKIYKESPGVNVLRTVNTTWATNGTPATQITILEDNSTQSETATAFDSNGILDSLIEYDWGSGAPGNPIRTTTLSYQTSTNYTNQNLINIVTSKVIKDGSGTVQYRQDTTYDGVALSSCPTGAAQHDDTGHPCGTNYRGNPTSITTYLTPATQSNGITKNFTYDWFGNLLTAQLNCCTNKTWTYSASTQYSQPDSVKSGTSPTQLTTTYSYNLYTGLTTKAIDPNGLETDSSYDFLRRATQVSQKNGSTTGSSATIIYNDTAFTTISTTTIDSSKSAQQISAVDGLGRTLTTTLEDVNSNVYSIVKNEYDLAGRAYGTSNPYVTGNPSYWTTTAFDVLGRATKVTLPDNSKTTYAYTTNTITATDPAGKQRKSTSDAAGRLTIVTEPDVTNNNSLTLNTTYTYTVLDALASVTTPDQSRTYSYDALGRLLSTVTPEGGKTCFGSVSGTTCNTDGYNTFDNLLKRTDARGVLTSYGYDGLNRLTSIGYTVVTGVSATSTVSLTYGLDSSCASAHGLGCIGQVITMTDGPGSENYTYNSLEQLTQLQKVVSGTTYTASYAYNLAGELTQITYPSGRVIQQSVDAIGRLCEIAPSTSACGSAASPYATGYGYNSAGQLTGFKYGNGIYASLGFSSDRLQLNCLDYSTTNRNGVCTHDSATKFGLGYSYGTAGSNNGQIASITDSVDNGRSAAYTYDGLARLSTAVTTGSTGYPAWGLQETYDRYGNRWTQAAKSGCTGVTCPQPSVAYNLATNHIIGSSYAYDANGNMTNDGINTLVYDAENRVASSSGAPGSGTYTYDGNGHRVIKVSGGTTTVAIFSGSQIIAEYQNGAAASSPTDEYIYSGGRKLAVLSATSTTYYNWDHLSVRLRTDSSGNIVDQRGHFPFGETWYAPTGVPWIFTTYYRDAESGNDYAQARYYINRLAQFSVLDPLSGSTSDPQSLNHYPYAGNDPIDNTDPSGQCIPPGGPLSGNVHQGFICQENGDFPMDAIGFPDNGYFSGSSSYIDPEGGVQYFPGLSFFAGLPSGDVYGGGQLGPAGGGGDTERARAAAIAILQGANPCADFFNKAPGIASAKLAEIPIATYKGPNYFQPFTDSNGNLNATMENAYLRPGPSGGTIELNQNGAFFQPTAYAGQNSPGVTFPRVQLTQGPFGGGTLGAQIIVLLHEFARMRQSKHMVDGCGMVMMRADCV